MNDESSGSEDRPSEQQLASEELQRLMHEIAKASEGLQRLMRQVTEPSEELQRLMRQVTEPSEELQRLMRQVTEPSEELQRLMRQVTEPSEELQRLMRQVTGPSEELQRLMRQVTGPSEELQRLMRQVTGPSSATTAATRSLAEPSDKLVPETSLEDEDQQDSEPVGADQSVPAAVAQLRSILDEAGRDSTVVSRPGPEREAVELRFSLPAGRDERLVVVDEPGAAALLEDENLLAWRSLTVYDGIWNEETSVIEVAVRGERFGPPPRMLRRALNVGSEDGARLLDLVAPTTNTRVVVGEAGATAAAILAYGMGHRRRAPMTLRCEGRDVTTTQAADDLIERIADALFFDIEVNSGVALVLSRLEKRSRPRRWRPSQRRDPSFPANQYPHAPLLLYRLGRDRSLPPVIRYWALYQVLEYFFPKYANEEALRRMGRHLRSPSFDPHREEDIVRLVALAGRSANSGERDDLGSTLEAITSPGELRDVIAELDIGGVLRRDGRELSVESVNPEADDVVRLLARRIYDIRCRIVHSKSSSPNELGPGLLAGTAHDDLIQPELPLLEYLAQQALIAAAEPLR